MTTLSINKRLYSDQNSYKKKGNEETNIFLSSTTIKEHNQHQQGLRAALTGHARSAVGHHAEKWYFIWRASHMDDNSICHKDSLAITEYEYLHVFGLGEVNFT